MKYEEILEKLDLVYLSVRREILTSKFALQVVKSEKHKELFEPKQQNIITRLNPKFKENHCNGNRLYMSAVPYMARILNGTIYKGMKQ